MTVYTLMAPTPPIELAELVILKLEAVSPTTGAAITGVTATNWSIYGRRLGDLELDLGDTDPSWVWAGDGAAA